MVGGGWLVGCHEQQRGRVIGDTQYYGLYLLIKDCVDAPLTHEFGRSVVRFRGPPPSGSAIVCYCCCVAEQRHLRHMYSYKFMAGWEDLLCLCPFVRQGSAYF